MAKSPIKTTVTSPIKYIGNSKNKKEPFGVICDLRIYSLNLNPEKIKELSIYSEKKGYFLLIFQAFIYLADNFPDQVCEVIKNSKGIEQLLNALKNPFCETQTEICRALAALATKSKNIYCFIIFIQIIDSCKMEIIKNGGFESICKLLNSSHMPLRIESSKALLHLS